MLSCVIPLLIEPLSCVGTGKTLIARALANECGGNERKVAFFMRKGADCLSKWVGESERQLRLLFDQVSGHFSSHLATFHQVSYSVNRVDRLALYYIKDTVYYL